MTTDSGNNGFESRVCASCMRQRVMETRGATLTYVEAELSVTST